MTLTEKINPDHVLGKLGAALMLAGVTIYIVVMIKEKRELGT